MKKPILTFSIIQLASSGIIVILFAINFTGDLKIIPIVVTILLTVLAIVSFQFLFVKPARLKTNTLEQQSKQIEHKDAEIDRLQAHINHFNENGLGDYYHFGNYHSFTQELGELLGAVDSLCGLLPGTIESLTVVQTEQVPIKTDINELIHTTAFITQNIQKAFDIADNLSASAKSAFDVSEQVQKGVQLVTAALQESLESSQQLFKQSQQISGILSLLAEISQRINILSINASIVSARAGTAGRPFKVVAKEIRKLATETEKSLNQIGEDIASIKSVINNVVEKITYSVEQTDAETSSLLSVVGSLQGITLGVEVFRAVSKAAKEKSKNQAEELNELSQGCILFKDVFQKVAGLKNDLERIIELRNLVSSRYDMLRSRITKPVEKEGGAP